MNLYKTILKPILFKLDPEFSHIITKKIIKLFFRIPFIKKSVKNNLSVKNEKQLFGLKFKNKIGLAAGFDKDANFINEADTLGFGFIEVGTVTPKDQNGNPKKRLFRLEEDRALVNRFGFNNKGVNSTIKNLSKERDIIVGGNIGKNKWTDLKNAKEDYKYCFQQLYNYVDYFAVNISSPNTEKLRELQKKEYLYDLLKSLVEINESKIKRKPILLKLSPDMTQKELDDILNIVLKLKIDGVIATNTTLFRGNLKSKNNNEKGGLSGKPLSNKSTELISYIYDKTNGNLPIIGAGGIFTSKDAKEKLNAGASLLQIYTGLVYEGPTIVRNINKKLINEKNNL